MIVNVRLRKVKALLGLAAMATAAVSAVAAHALISDGGHSTARATTVVAEGDTPIVRG